MKTTRLFKKLALKAFRTGNNKVVRGDGSKTNKTVEDLSNKLKNNKSKYLTYMLNIGAIKKPTFLTPNTKKTFNCLRLAFIKTSIF